MAKLILCFACVHGFSFTYWTLFTSTYTFSHFYPYSLYHSTGGESENDCVVFRCQPGLKHDLPLPCTLWIKNITTTHLCFRDLCIHRVLCFKDILYFLFGTARQGKTNTLWTAFPIAINSTERPHDLQDWVWDKVLHQLNSKYIFLLPCPPQEVQV